MIIKGNLRYFPVWGIACLMTGMILASCMGARQKGSGQETIQSNETQTAENTEHEPAAGLVLTSADAGENEAITAAMEKLAEENGFRLIVYTPDVSSEEAEEAGKLEAGSFASCDVDPIEYQMLGVNALVAEDVDVIAIHPNHGEALESVLGAARGVGIRICSWGREPAGESTDLYVESAQEVPAAVLELLKTEE